MRFLYLIITPFSIAVTVAGSDLQRPPDVEKNASGKCPSVLWSLDFTSKTEPTSSQTSISAASLSSHPISTALLAHGHTPATPFTSALLSVFPLSKSAPSAFRQPGLVDFTLRFHSGC
jgi:hypothetical protein